MNYSKNKEIISTLSEKIFNDITKDNTYYSLDEIYKKIYDSTPEMVKNILESLDDYIFNNSNRKKRYDSKGFYKRTIITKYGEVTFKRRYYISKDKINENGFLLDRYLNLIPYSKLTREAKIQVINSIADNQSYRAAGKNAINGVTLSKQSVFNCLKNAIIESKPRRVKLKVPVIHISIDGFFVSQKGNKNKTEKKFANFFTGIEKVGKKRFKLINSFVIVQNNQNSFLKALKKALNDNFDLSNNPKIIIGGDGAPWIKTLAFELNAKFAIDKFHYLKVLHKYLSKEELKEAYSSLNKGDYNFYKNYKNYFAIINSETGELSYNDDYKFLDNNSKYTLTWLDKDYIGTFAEQTVSHVFNLRTRSIPRSWASNINKVMFLLTNSNSNDLDISFDNDLDFTFHDIDDLYLSSIDLSSFNSSKKSFISLINYNAPSSKLTNLKHL